MRQQGCGQADRAEQVDRHRCLGSNQVERVGQRVLRCHNARVVDQNVQGRVILADACAKRCDRPWVSHVQRDEHHSRIGRSHLPKRPGASPGDDDAVAARVKCLGQPAAYPRTAPGDEDCVARHLHAALLCPRHAWPGCLDIRFRPKPSLPNPPLCLPNPPETLARSPEAATVEGMMSDLVHLVRHYADAHADQDGLAALPLPGVGAMRAYAPTELLKSVYKPLVCLVLQGSKQIRLGLETHEFASGQCAVVSAHVPVISRITRASLAEPYLALAVELDMEILLDIAGYASGNAAVVGSTRRRRRSPTARCGWCAC